MKCQSCGTAGVDFTTVRRRESDGHAVVFRQCDHCGGNWDGKFQAKAKVNFASLPWTKPRPITYCEQCGAAYAQEHHYFPRALAKLVGIDADRWPTQKLCGQCHGTWHKTVTPGLVKKDW